MGLGAPLLEAEEVLDGAGEGGEDVGLELWNAHNTGALEGEPGKPDLLQGLPVGILDPDRLLTVQYVDLDPRLITELPDPEAVEHDFRSSI